MVIMQDAPPKLKRFLKPLGRKATVRALLIRCIVAFLLHRGRMGAARAAGAVRSEPRHRAQIARFLGRKMLRRLSPASVLRSQVLAMESQKSGTFLFVVDQTLTSQQGRKTENTFSSGNRQRRPGKGLLLTPSGLRLPFCRSYYTRAYCQTKGKPYRTQTELAAEMIQELPLPEGAKVVV